MKIGIFGGSFNPIHIGHQNIADDAIRFLSLDKLIFVPAHKSPFKKKIKYEDDNHRINMIKLILKEKMEVSDFEVKRKGTSYTIDTVKYFKSIYPKDELVLIIGSDQLYKLHKWRDIEKITKLAQIVVFRREGVFSKINIKKYSLKLLNNSLYNFSSTDIRKGDFSQIDPEVNEYIGKNHLYIGDILLGMLTPKRHKHSMATGRLAAEYAKLLGEDPKKSWLAGVFHDITKNWTNQKHREFLKELKVDDSQIQDYQLHSLTGSLWLERIYKVNDAQVVEAVKKHTTLALELSRLDKIIYAADKLSEGRNWPGIQSLRKEVKNNFETGFKNLIIKTRETILENRGENSIDKEQDAIYSKILGG